MNTEIKEKEFVAELGNSKWTGEIRFKQLNPKYCVAEAEARGTTFTIAVTCYYEGYGTREYCICVPNYNFGCQLSSISAEWNEEQFQKYIKNKVDRRSLVCAVEVILEEIEGMQGR